MTTKKPSSGGRGRPKSDASLTAEEGEEEEGAEEANVIPLDIGIPVGDRTQLADEASGKPPAAAWTTEEPQSKENERKGQRSSLHQPRGEGRHREDDGDYAENQEEVRHGSHP